jgi:hypothetical protein
MYRHSSFLLNPASQHHSYRSTSDQARRKNSFFYCWIVHVSDKATKLPLSAFVYIYIYDSLRGSAPPPHAPFSMSTCPRQEQVKRIPSIKKTQIFNGVNLSWRAGTGPRISCSGRDGTASPLGNRTFGLAMRGFLEHVQSWRHTYHRTREKLCRVFPNVLCIISVLYLVMQCHL